jgi:hypothetical protein
MLDNFKHLKLPESFLEQNVGTIDRVVRFVAGIILISLVFTTDGPTRWLGLIGFAPLFSAASGVCFLYRACNVSSKK